MFEKLLKNKFTTIIFFIITNFLFWTRPFFGLDFSDTFFHLNVALYSDMENFYVPFFLSSEFIQFAASFIGENLIGLRFLNAFLLYLSLMFPFFILRKLEYKFLLVSISCGLLILYTLNVNILSYDTLSIFILSLIFSFTCKFVLNERYWLLLILVFLSAIAVFIRLPNVVILIILLAVIWYQSGLKNALRFIILTLLVIIGGYLSYFKTIPNFLNSWYTTDTHSIANLLMGYQRDLGRLFFYIFSILAMYFLSAKLEKWQFTRRYRILILIILLGIFLSIAVGFSAYWGNFSLFLTATVIVCVLIKNFTNTATKASNFKKFSLILFLFLFIIPSGSDTGLLKACLMFIHFPFVVANSKKDDYFWRLILIVLAFFSLVQGLAMTYQDSPVHRLKRTPDVPNIEQIYTNNGRAVYLESVYKEIEILKKQNYKILVYGDRSHVLKYIFPESLSISSFYQPLDNWNDLKKIEALLPNGKTALFLIDEYPPDMSLKFPKEFVEKHKLKKVSKTGIKYYLKK